MFVNVMPMHVTVSVTSDTSPMNDPHLTEIIKNMWLKLPNVIDVTYIDGAIATLQIEYEYYNEGMHFQIEEVARNIETMYKLYQNPTCTY